jgi:uncharacterized protein
VTALEIRDFPGAGDPTALLPVRHRENAPHRDALGEGRLVLQACDDCGRLRYPIAPVCPYCGGRAASWRECRGDGTVHSWVRHHRGYLPEFEPLMPYDVVCVTLSEGPRMIGRLAAAPGGAGGEPWIGMPVRAIVERFAGGGHAVAFIAAGVM